MLAKEDKCTYTMLFGLYVYFIMTLIFRYQYYNNPIETFDCFIDNTEIEEINSEWRITADIIDISTNNTFDSRLACWDSQECNEIVNEYFSEEQTMCAKRRVSGLFTKQKSFVTPLNIPYYTGDVISNVFMWIFLSCYTLIVIILCAVLFDENSLNNDNTTV